MMTITEAIEDVILYYESRNKSPKTATNLKNRLFVFLYYMQDYFNLKQVHLIRSNHLHDYHVFITSQTDSKGNPWTPEYVNVHFWALRMMLNHLKKFNYIAMNLAELVENVDTPETLPKYVMNHEEVELMLAQIDTSRDIGYRDYVLFSLIASSGIRVESCSMLDVTDINLNERTVFIRKAKGDKQYLAVFSEQVKVLLQNFLTAIRPMWRNADSLNALFINERGQRLGIKGIATAMKVYIERAELNPKYTPHSLRKYVVTSLVKANSNPAHIQRLMNWSSLRPLKNYAKMSVDDLKQTLDACHPMSQRRKSS